LVDGEYSPSTGTVAVLQLAAAIALRRWSNVHKEMSSLLQVRL
jgi:hypothetical protein